MAQQIISLGTAPDDGTGDDLRTGGDKINDNFTELYGLITEANVFNAVIDISSAELLSLNSTPKLLIPSPGPNKVCLLIGYYVRYLFATAAYATNTILRFQTSETSQTLNSLPSIISQTADRFYIQAGTISLNSATDFEDEGVELIVATGDPTDGGGSLKIGVTYIIYDLT